MSDPRSTDERSRFNPMREMNAALARYAYATHDKPTAELWNALSEATRQLDEAATLLTHASYQEFSAMPRDDWHDRRMTFLKNSERPV